MQVPIACRCASVPDIWFRGFYVRANNSATQDEWDSLNTIFLRGKTSYISIVSNIILYDFACIDSSNYLISLQKIPVPQPFLVLNLNDKDGLFCPLREPREPRRSWIFIGGALDVDK